MQTPWGKLPVSDAHIHFFSHRFFTLLASQKNCSLSDIGWLLPDWEMPPVEPERLAERWAAELDRHQAGRAVLIASLPGDEESVVSAVSAFPGRFRGYFMANPVAGDCAARVARTLDRGLRGICLFPAMHRYSLHDERVQPVFDLAASRPGTIVFVHCGLLSVGVRARLGLPSLFDMRYSNPLDLHAVALKYPKLPFIIPHFGAGFFREALMVADLCPNVYLDTSSSNNWMRYLTPGTDLKAVFRQALAVVGPRRLLFGTDSSFFPRGWIAAVLAQQASVLYEIGISTADACAIFGGNLDRLLE